MEQDKFVYESVDNTTDESCIKVEQAKKKSKHHWNIEEFYLAFINYYINNLQSNFSGLVAMHYYFLQIMKHVSVSEATRFNSPFAFVLVI